jgi:hypothetical protein
MKKKINTGLGVTRRSVEFTGFLCRFPAPRYRTTGTEAGRYRKHNLCQTRRHHCFDIPLAIIKVLAGVVRAARRGAILRRTRLAVGQHGTCLKLIIAVRGVPSFKKRFPRILLAGKQVSLDLLSGSSLCFRSPEALPFVAPV